MMKKLQLLALIFLIGIFKGYSQNLPDVWDFGATQLDESQYNNMLTVDVINSWYDSSITPGSSSTDNVLPDFTVGDLSWTGGGNDRLRTTNTDLTRYDENINDYADFKGRIYVNSRGATDRFFSLELQKYDEVTIWARGQDGAGNIHFEYVADPSLQNDTAKTTGDPTELTFTAKASGTYHIYDDTDKPSYYRITRKSAAVSTITGSVDVTAADGIPGDYNIVFTNEDGDATSTSVSSGTYTIDLLAGHQYDVSLEGADGYSISSLTNLEVTESTSSFDVTIKKDGVSTGDGLTDVWDFGATQLDASQYDNQLTVDEINSWYDSSVTPGSSSTDNVLPDFTTGILSWTGGGNDRLRTSNTDLTRYDENINDYADFKGRIYVNSSGATGRYFSLDLNEDDVVTIWALAQNENGNLHFEYVADPDLQNDTAAVGGEPTEVTFVAKAAGIYHIYDDTDKPSYFRITRKSATYASINGNVDVSAASGIPDGYSIVFTNDAGKTWSASVSGGMYSVDLPTGYQYDISLEGADAYTISNGTTLEVTESTSSYDITVEGGGDTSVSEPGKTYTYSFADGSVIPQTSYSTLRYDTFQTSDEIVTINSNTSDDSGKFGYHDSTHGIVMFPGNSFDIMVAGDATITFIVCKYGSATDAVFEFTDADGNVLGSIAAQNIEEGTDAFPSSFTYKGPAGKITATLKSDGYPTAEVYIHGMVLENAAATEPSNGLADVWDFGATQLDETQYNNKLTVDIINSFYDSSITPGTSGINLPSFTAGALGWIGGGNDRLRTVNTALTRYDENINDYEDFKGRLYVNSGGATGRYISLNLNEDDEISLWALTQNGTGNLHFEYVPDPSMQNDEVAVGGDITELHFVAKAAGTYHIYDDTDKPSYFRVIRKPATYVNLSGNVDVTDAAGIPDGYQIAFTNDAGKTWTSPVSGGTYNVNLPAGYQYGISLEGANGYIISNGSTLEVTESTTSYDITIQKVEIYKVTGSITGLGDDISSLTKLTFVPDPDANSIYVPQPTMDTDAATYSVQLEPNLEYTILAEGVNDYYIPDNTIEITGDTNQDITFELKPKQDVTIVANGLTDAQKDDLTVTFTNLNEPDYSYTFTDINAVSLRDGVYSVSISGLDKYPLQLAPTSNLMVDGEAVSKTLDFEMVTNWSFDDQVITNDTQYYKGLEFTGSIKNEIAKGHLAAGSGGTIAVPLEPGQKMVVSYYYAADFSIDGGDPVTTSSGSTSQIESVTYVYPGAEAGTAVITINATSYITNIEVIDIVAYSPEITVGEDKDYQTINEALDAISRMDRPNDERVTVLIDPGNYEEMVVIDQNNITLKNAANIPSIELTNQGVDIADNAVRITSYYGYGYNYYSQGTDNKWHADVLAVNKANGYQPYNNVSGTTNASYWDATLVVSADGFIAEDLIIENSFNQYISKKESEDVVVMVSGNRGERPTDYGNTSVQDRSFVERAAAIGIANGSDKVILDKCRIVGRQDSFYGGSNTRVAIYKGAMMGAVDYIFGGMTAVFYKSDLVLNTSDVSSDAAYITAAQQDGGRGFLMYECNIISTEPGVNTASSQGAKPGYFGRPWQANTSEVVFYNTFIDTSTYPGFEGQSLINPEGWRNTLGGESDKMYEYGTVEASGVDHSGDRVEWATVLDEPVLKDGTEITTFNFTKGDDGWDPFPEMEANDDTDHDGILDSDDNCISTPNPDQADMDGDGIGDVCDDSDGDGLVDAEDQCPNSPEGAVVDVFGCEVFDLAADNYTITVHDVSCNGNGDGYISVSAEDTNYTYNVMVSGAGSGSATLSSSNQFTGDVENLSAGTYDVCITVDGRDDYEQCFSVTVQGPSPLAAYSSVNYGNNTVSFSMSGADSYTIDHNGEIMTTTQSNVVLDLKEGRNTFAIYTDSECQGEVYKEVLMSKKVVLFPNPTQGEVNVYINGEDTKIDITLVDLNGREYFSKNMNVPADRVISLDLTNYIDGVYFLVLKSETVSKSIKLIKS